MRGTWKLSTQNESLGKVISQMVLRSGALISPQVPKENKYYLYTVLPFTFTAGHRKDNEAFLKRNHFFIVGIIAANLCTAYSHLQ